jgi:hypothetical protein
MQHALVAVAPLSMDRKHGPLGHKHNQKRERDERKHGDTGRLTWSCGAVVGRKLTRASDGVAAMVALNQAVARSLRGVLPPRARSTPSAGPPHV